MKSALAVVLVIATAVLIGMAWYQSGASEQHELRAASTPEQAVRLVLSQIQAHDFDGAYVRLANRADVDKESFVPGKLSALGCNQSRCR